MTHASDQPPLFTDDDAPPAVAEVALVALAADYREIAAKRTPGQALDREADELSFACLLICSESVGLIRRRQAVDHLDASRQTALAGSPLDWLDALPWDLMFDRLYPERADAVTRTFPRLLSHHTSNIRGFLVELAWFVRRRLPPLAADRLFKNTADTLMGWYLSLGLCSTLFEDEDAFWHAADAYEPPDSFATQYRDRIEKIRGVGLGVCLYSFANLETRVRTLIDRRAWALPAGVPPPSLP